MGNELSGYTVSEEQTCFAGPSQLWEVGLAALNQLICTPFFFAYKHQKNFISKHLSSLPSLSALHHLSVP
jgi:hypothetical protein